MRLLPTTRKLIADAIRRGIHINVAAEVFGVCRQTASKWFHGKGHRGRGRFLDKKRKPKQSKVTLKLNWQF